MCSFIQKGIYAITTPIFTRILSTAEYGQFNDYQSWRAILVVFVTLNLFYGVYTSGLVKFKEHRNEFVSAFEGLTLMMVLFWFGVYWLFKNPINQLLSMNTTKMICMFSTFWTSAVFSFWAAEQRVDYKYKKLVIITLIYAIAKPIIEISFILNAKDRVTARIVGIAVSEMILLSWMFFVHIRQCTKLFSGFFWKYALRLNIPLIPHYLAQSLLSSSDRIVIKRIVSDSAAGIYGLAYSVSMIMSIFNTALSQALGPWIYEKIKTRKETEIQSVLLPSVILVAFVNILLILFAPEIIRFFAPAAYYEAIWTMPPVTMSVYFIYLYDIFSYYEFYYEKTSFIALATMVAAVLNLILNFICIRLFGYIAAGYTTLFCFMLYAFGHYIAMRHIAEKYLDGNTILSLKSIIPITTCFMMVGFVFCGLYNHPVIRYIAVIIIIAGAYYNRIRIAKYVSMLLVLKGRRRGE